jgi:hypothetical protein
LKGIVVPDAAIVRLRCQQDWRKRYPSAVAIANGPAIDVHRRTGVTLVSSTAELPLGRISAAYARVPGTSLLDTTTITHNATAAMTVDCDYGSLMHYVDGIAPGGRIGRLAAKKALRLESNMLLM